MIRIDDYWASWREDIRNAGIDAEDGPRPDSAVDHDRILSNQAHILKALWWLLNEAAAQEPTP